MTAGFSGWGAGRHYPHPHRTKIVRRIASDLFPRCTGSMLDKIIEEKWP